MRAAAARPPKSARAKADGMLKHPYLLFIGNAADSLAAKTAAGIVQWRPDWCLGQNRLPGCRADLGLPDMTPEEAAGTGAGTMIVGGTGRST